MKEARTTIYFCHVCSYRSNYRNDFASHMKHTNHNNKFSYNCRNCNCIAIKKQEIQKKKFLIQKELFILKKKMNATNYQIKLKICSLKLKTGN